jgi:hypothetical protein
VIEPFPTLTRPATPTEGLACGWDDTLPDLTVPCGEPAAWHIWITTGPHPTAVLLCDPHTALYRTAHVWHDHHPARPACAQAGHTWHHDHCTEEPTP